jgi:uncharacterized protein
LNELRFEWDPAKAAANFRKHGVSFEEASTVFKSPNVLIKPDEAHSLVEDRANAIGFSDKGRLLLIVMTERQADDIIRIISARKATKREARDYARTQG